MAELVIKSPAVATPAVLGFAATITAIAAPVVTSRGLVPGAAPLVVAGIASGAILTLTLLGGTDGEIYDVAAQVTLQGGDAAEQSLEVAPIAPDWAMPDGSAGWLSIVEFFERVGYNEALALTRRDGGGRYDRSFLIGALRDAQAEAEANIAARYALPLVVVPAIVKTAVADMAEARLHGQGIPAQLADQVKAHRRTLERIASGALPLPLPAGTSIETAASDAPIAWYSDGRAYPDNLSGY